MATIVERAKERIGVDTRPNMPREIEERVNRGRDRRDELAPERRVAMEFARGNNYVYVNEANKFQSQSTRPSGGGKNGKPNHRVRNSRSLFFPIIDAKVSAATQRVPGYDILPTTTDNEAVGGARLANRVAQAGYEAWNVDTATEASVWYALVADEGFAMPYWDTSIGPYIEGPDGSAVGIGDVRIRTFGPTEVGWEPGVDFEDSRWYFVEHARPVAAIKDEPGYLGGDLRPDASSNKDATQNTPGKHELCLVTEYFERPCPRYPSGRHLTFANGKQIFPDADYPRKDANGNAIDEPPMHRLSYAVDPENDSDMGLGRFLVDVQRTFDDSLNKISEWKNHCLMPQIMAPEGSFIREPSDEPGEIVYYKTIPGMPEPRWRDVPPIPRELFELSDRMQMLAGFIASSNDVPQNIESGKGIAALIEKDNLAWQRFIKKLAKFHSRLMRHCLTLVQTHYSEPRIMHYRGLTGWEATEDFRGLDLHGQTDVRVLPGSLEPRTREAIEQKVMTFAQLGWITPLQAMSAINGGTAEKLIDTYERHVARAHQVIKKIKAGTLFDEPWRPVTADEPPYFDPESGVTLSEVPGWMPRPFDDAALQRTVFEDWMMTYDYDMLPPETKEAANVYHSALVSFQQQREMQEQQALAQQAEDQGSFNASKPADEGKPMPSLPALNQGSGNQSLSGPA